MLLSPHKYPERILLYGEPGTGKSHAVITLAKFLEATHSDAYIRVLDNDRSYRRAVENNNLSHVAVEDVYDFPEYRKSLTEFLRASQPNDWLVCDLMSEAWTAAQTYYTESVYGDDANYFMQVRAAMTNPNKENVLEGWTDWQFINKQYFAFAKPFVYKSPCNIIAVSTADPLNRTGRNVDDKETVSVYNQVGWKPEGQKRLKHQFDTTIFMFKDNSSNYRMTSVKDRDRALLVSRPVNNFAIDYLVTTAGWTII